MIWLVVIDPKKQCTHLALPANPSHESTLAKYYWYTSCCNTVSCSHIRSGALMHAYFGNQENSQKFWLALLALAEMILIKILFYLMYLPASDGIAIEQFVN